MPTVIHLKNFLILISNLLFCIIIILRIEINTVSFVFNILFDFNSLCSESMFLDINKSLLLITIIIFTFLKINLVPIKIKYNININII